jgi:hypothetical protein
VLNFLDKGSLKKERIVQWVKNWKKHFTKLGLCTIAHYQGHNDTEMMKTMSWFCKN